MELSHASSVGRSSRRIKRRCQDPQAPFGYAGVKALGIARTASPPCPPYILRSSPKPKEA